MSTPRWQEIADAVRAQIEAGALQPGDRLPSESELAARWGACRMTAHRAMHELQRLGLVTRQRRRGTVVAQPAAGRTGFVGLLFYHTSDFPQVEYIHGIRAALPDEYHLLFCDTHNDPAREAQYLRRMQKEADGIVCYPTCAPENTPLLRRLAESGMPVVCVDRAPANLEIDAVVTDNFGSSRDALRFLREGSHTRVAHFTENDLHRSSIRERREAYREAMAEAGQPDPSRWERLFPAGLGNDFPRLVQGIHDALFTLLHQPDPPTAVFCPKDWFLAATLEACDRLGVRIPGDLEVVSFSDCPPLFQRLPGGVHRIVQRATAMGRMAAERLQARMDGAGAAVLPAEVVRVPAEFFPAPEAAGSGLLATRS